MCMSVCTCTSVWCSSCSSLKDLFCLILTYLLCAGEQGDLEDAKMCLSHCFHECEPMLEGDKRDNVVPRVHVGVQESWGVV